MAKLRQRHESGWYHYEFNCPGCGYAHGFYVERPGFAGSVWNFDGNLEQPTVWPSILMSTSQSGVPYICHSFITAGKIHFCADSTHILAGQTVELPQIEHYDNSD